MQRQWLQLRVDLRVRFVESFCLRDVLEVLHALLHEFLDIIDLGKDLCVSATLYEPQQIFIYRFDGVLIAIVDIKYLQLLIESLPLGVVLGYELFLELVALFFKLLDDLSESVLDEVDLLLLHALNLVHFVLDVRHVPVVSGARALHE